MIVLADSTVDLRYALAYPPNSDYVEVTPTATILDGPFTAQQYAAYLKAIGQDASTVVTGFRLYGFTRGYARSWVEKGTLRALIERAFEFSSGSGANSFYEAIKVASGKAKESRGSIDTGGTPDSFGFKADEGTFHDYIGLLVKGNAVYEALMGSRTDDLTSALQLQVHALFETAPPETIPKGQWKDPLTAAVTNSFRLPSAVIVVALAVVALVMVAVLLIVILALRRPRGLAVPIVPSMSPDGAYWWDGQRWRQASFDPPPSAPRSPDGAYWWDGRNWRPAGTPRPFA
jgi:hypothetical protein